MENDFVLYRGSQKILTKLPLEKVHESDEDKLKKRRIKAKKVAWATPVKRHALPQL